MSPLFHNHNQFCFTFATAGDCREAPLDRKKMLIPIDFSPCRRAVSMEFHKMRRKRLKRGPHNPIRRGPKTYPVFKPAFCRLAGAPYTNVIAMVQFASMGYRGRLSAALASRKGCINSKYKTRGGLDRLIPASSPQTRTTPSQSSPPSPHKSPPPRSSPPPLTSDF